MCGFAGELRFDGRAADLAAVERMSDSMQRRGPDGCGSWQRGPVALAHRDARRAHTARTATRFGCRTP